MKAIKVLKVKFYAFGEYRVLYVKKTNFSNNVTAEDRNQIEGIISSLIITAGVVSIDIDRITEEKYQNSENIDKIKTHLNKVIEYKEND